MSNHTMAHLCTRRPPMPILLTLHQPYCSSVLYTPNVDIYWLAAGSGHHLCGHSWWFTCSIFFNNIKHSWRCTNHCSLSSNKTNDGNVITAESSLTRPIRQDDTIITTAASIHPLPSSSNNEYLEMHHHNYQTSNNNIIGIHFYMWWIQT